MAGSTPTPKARALGAAVKAAREARGGFSQRRLAQEIGRDPGLVSRWESGERTPKPADIAQILAVLGINGEEAADLLDMAGGTEEARWLAVTLPEQRQQLGALLGFERTAKMITKVAPLLVPGVLQTSDYIRAIMTAGGGVPVEEIDERVAVRIGRREVITRRNPAHMMVLLGEAALRQIIGSRHIMADQLRYLLELAELPNVDLQVVSVNSGWNPLLEGWFTLIDSDEVPPVVNLENRRSGLFLHEPEDVDIYREAVRTIQNVAMSPADTTGLIADVINEMETTQ